MKLFATKLIFWAIGGHLANSILLTLHASVNQT